MTRGVAVCLAQKAFRKHYQVVKQRKGRRMVDVSTRVICGTPDAGAARVAHSPGSWTVNTSVVGGDNLAQRPSALCLLWLASIRLYCDLLRGLYLW